jgi:hypothetical protein
MLIVLLVSEWCALPLFWQFYWHQALNNMRPLLKAFVRLSTTLCALFLRQEIAFGSIISSMSVE